MISFRSDREGLPPRAEDSLTFSERSRTELREQVDSFNRHAELRTRLQNIYPDWRPTEAHRFVVGIMRDVGARLHPLALQECPFPSESASLGELPSISAVERQGLIGRLGDLYRRVSAAFGGSLEPSNDRIQITNDATPTRSPEEVALEARALLLFERSLKNIARYAKSEPLEETVDGDLRSILCSPSSDRYREEYLGSMWAVQAALYTFRDNESLLSQSFGVMRRNLTDMLLICSDESSFNQVMGTMQVVARRSEIFKKVLLDQSWLGLSTEDIPGDIKRDSVP